MTFPINFPSEQTRRGLFTALRCLSTLSRSCCFVVLLSLAHALLLAQSRIERGLRPNTRQKFCIAANATRCASLRRVAAKKESVVLFHLHLAR